MQSDFDAVVLAGHDPHRPDPLAQANGVASKALIEIAGRPMIWHVVQALAQSKRVARIVVVGLEPSLALDTARTPTYLPGKETLIDNVIHGFEWLATQASTQRYALLLNADTPLLTSSMVEWFLDACHPLRYDVYWGIVERRTMEATFPGSTRTYLRLVEGQFCNGGIFLGTVEAALGRQTLLRQLVAERKNVVRQLRLMGPGVILRFLLRRLRQPHLLAVCERLLGWQGMTVTLPFAEPGMDVDKPHQLDQVRSYWLAHHPPAQQPEAQADGDLSHV